MNWDLAYSFPKGLDQTNLTEEQDEAVSSYPQTRYPWVLDRCWRCRGGSEASCQCTHAQRPAPGPEITVMSNRW